MTLLKTSQKQCFWTVPQGFQNLPEQLRILRPAAASRQLYLQINRAIGLKDLVIKNTLMCLGRMQVCASFTALLKSTGPPVYIYI